jgi:hypothetical protein
MSVVSGGSYGCEKLSALFCVACKKRRSDNFTSRADAAPNAEISYGFDRVRSLMQFAETKQESWLPGLDSN